MVNGNKVAIAFFIILMTMCLNITYSYSQEKPSEQVIKDLIILLEKDSNLLPLYLKNVQYNTFGIIQEFYSSQNGRYCIKINSDISFEGRKSTLARFEPRNVRLINKRYSFVKKHNQWIGYKGWGPGED